MAVTPIRCILLDIEGTTTRISFVHEVLFPYAREHIGSFLMTHLDEPRIQSCLQDPVLGAPTTPVRKEDLPPLVSRLHQWIDDDRKETVLKTLQGYIWAEGFEKGVYQSHIYEDVLPALKRWKEKGLELGIYSSGSVDAQKLLFGYTPYGDLTSFFSYHFDTHMGGKKEKSSYEKICHAMGRDGAEVLFISDSLDEVRAAQQAGLTAHHIQREGEAKEGSLASFAGIF
jgi:enolase-phosphatase E1